MAGMLGIGVSEIYELTPRQAANLRIGATEMIEAIDRSAWMRARTTAFYSVAPHSKKGGLNEPRDLWKFDWEEKQIDKENRKKLKEATRIFPSILPEEFRQ